MTEHQVAKLMEEDMGSAMQYLQGKDLCLMPISFALAISITTCHSRNPMVVVAAIAVSNINNDSVNPVFRLMRFHSMVSSILILKNDFID